ncbi:probable G-protein coupled receptor 139 [Leucoraja erinacea]|uniref:probable G-protein coupled receptor 139 n=1 Tax=Leucoraja erinaceus TaxID=7782 RepID=UPI002458B7A5|nr:probable G-protein coupled receptor 139 [Leucoraja erinacea]
MEKGVFHWADYLVYWNSLSDRIYIAIRIMQPVFYPMLALVALPVNTLTIVVLSRGKCGLSTGVTRYLMAMATADLLVIIVDLIMRQIPIAYYEAFRFLEVVPKLKTNYCTERTAAVVLGTVTVLSCLKNIFWYFMLSGWYMLYNGPWFCWGRSGVHESLAWGIGEFLQYLITPVMPFVLIVVFNTLTIRYVLMASRARRRLRGPRSGESGRDPEMESRRKSLILLLVISGNFIVLWAVYAVYVVWYRLASLFPSWANPDNSISELGYMLQTLSCCTNTALYAVTQTKFRQQFKQVVKSPVSLIVKCTQRRVV